MPSSEKNGFEQAINLISTRVKVILYLLPESQIERITEIRLRINKPVIAVTDKGSLFLTDKGRLTGVNSESCVILTAQELNDTVNRMCNYSVHSNQQSINNGFITINGGHRVGICGTASFSDSQNFNVRDISSINIRIARQVFGAAKKVTDKCFDDGLNSVIIAGAPSSGKTTMLKDLAFRLSNGYTGPFYKTAVADERGELSAAFNGIQQNDLGVNTDVLVNYKKQAAVEIALRSLSPEIIIFDEITSFDEIDSIKTGLNSGVCFAVSIHCGNEKEMREKDLLKELLNTKSFKYIVLLDSQPCAGSVKAIYKLEYCGDEVSWTVINTD